MPFFKENRNLKPMEKFKLRTEVSWEGFFEHNRSNNIYFFDPLMYSKEPSNGCGLKINFLFADIEILNKYFIVYKAKRDLDLEEVYRSRAVKTDDGYLFSHEIKCVDDSLYIVAVMDIERR